MKRKRTLGTGRIRGHQVGSQHLIAAQHQSQLVERHVVLQGGELLLLALDAGAARLQTGLAHTHIHAAVEESVPAVNVVCTSLLSSV